MSNSAVHDVIIGASMSPSTIHQCQQTSLEANVEEVIHSMSGAVDPSSVSVKKAEPKAPITTFDLAGFLTALPVSSGLKIDSGTIILPYKKRANEGIFETGQDLIIAGTNGIAVPLSITGGQNDEGSVGNAEVWFKSTNGLLSPVTISTGNTAAAQSFNASYAMGPAVINGTQLPDVVRTTATFGLEVTAKVYDGGVFIMRLTINRRRPTFEIEFEDLDSLVGLGPLFSSLTSCDVYHRKYLDGSTFVPDATAEHIKLTLTDGLTAVQDASAQETEDGKASIKLTGKTISSSTTSAISF